MQKATKRTGEEPQPEDTRSGVIEAAIALLTAGGRDAVTTRAVADAAGVQAPTIYRIFGDKGGLLDAVAEHGFATYLGQKRRRKAPRDPVEELRRGWDVHVDFGLSHPALYLLMYADPKPGLRTPAAETSSRMLRELIHRVAVAGRLRLNERRAADLFHAAASGVVLLLLGTEVERRDKELSRLARESALGLIVAGDAGAVASGAAVAAVTLRSLLPEVTEFSDGEKVLLGEWLDRLG